MTATAAPSGTHDRLLKGILGRFQPHVAAPGAVAGEPFAAPERLATAELGPTPPTPKHRSRVKRCLPNAYLKVLISGS
jgi:hypothetical protein